MAYRRREPSGLDIYHVMVRGTGRQLLFEDDVDREVFLLIIGELAEPMQLELYAWCLMGNHVHLLVHAEMGFLAAFMRDAGRRYSRYFNDRHDRVGHLTQGRYRSVPIRSEEQLLTAVRYIHRNPVEAGLSPSCLYRWSSYGEYIGLSIYELVETSAVLASFSGVASFEDFHATARESDTDAPGIGRVFRFDDAMALREFKLLLATEGADALPLDDRVERNRLIRLLKGRGLTIRQIGALTGLGRNIIARA